MIGIDHILEIRTESDFQKIALQLFVQQSQRCAPYREYIELLGIDTKRVDSIDKIPFLPIELFKSHKIYGGEKKEEIIFTSSTTGGGDPCKHYVAKLSDYEATFNSAFELFYGKPSDYAFFALLPGYMERKGSSLIYMVDQLIKSGTGGFYLNQYQQMLREMDRHEGKKILFGVSYALLELAERFPRKLENTIIMETGGMKGRREEIPKQELHSILCEAFGLDKIDSEYGMAELMSQAYSSGEGVFKSPPWMKIILRDINNPLSILSGEGRGAINIIDLANIHSCAFIQSQDIGFLSETGEFEILGRIDRSDTRGCNLLIQ